MIKKIWRRLYCPLLEVITQPKRELEKYRQVLLDSGRGISQVHMDLNYNGRAKANGIKHIIGFFQVTSTLQDALPIHDLIQRFQAVNYGQYDQLLARLHRLAGHLERAGRDLHGVNRTKKNEAVTDHNVWLGGVYGTFTYTVRHWDTELSNLPEYKLVSFWAADFIYSHWDEIWQDVGYLVHITLDGMRANPALHIVKVN